MREKINRFMTGRNGNDELNAVLLGLGLVLIIVGAIIGEASKKFLFILVFALLSYVYFRMFSRNIYKRREENEKYLRLKHRVLSRLRLLKERWTQRKDYKFFICAKCRTVLRVPRGKGNIRVVCRKCGNSFIAKS